MKKQNLSALELLGKHSVATENMFKELLLLAISELREELKELREELKELKDENESLQSEIDDFRVSSEGIDIVDPRSLIVETDDGLDDYRDGSGRYNWSYNN